ncbi:MAG: DUF896 domain-containing protein [Christensenellales bacterium]
MEHEKILRINELAKKKKEVGLTDEEAEERKTLHAQYIKKSFANRPRQPSSAFAWNRTTAAISRW